MKTISLDRYITYYIYSFFYSSVVLWPLDYTHILATVNNAAVDMGMKILQDIGCIFCLSIPSEISGFLGSLILIV